MSAVSSSNQREYRTLQVNKDLIYSHLLGIFCFISFATLPTSIPLTRYFGEVPVKISGLILLLLVATSIFLRLQKRAYLKFFVLFASLGFFLAGTFRLDPSRMFVESIPVLEFVGGVIAFSMISSEKQLMTTVKYVISCLWVSLAVTLAMLAGILENPYRSRASFSGSAISDIGIGRIVTPTHLLAGICIGIAVHLWISKRVSPKMLVLLIAPSAVIAGLASTRLIAVLIIVPLLFGVFLGQNKASRARLFWLASFTALSPALLNLLSQTVLPQIEIVANYVDNFVARVSSGFLSNNTSATDASSFYREQENYFASQFIAANPIFGGGFSSTYMNFPLVSDNSFLGLQGNAYVHNTYLWILVKTGFVGLILFCLGIAKVIRASNKSVYRYESHLFLSLLVALLIVAFVWNMLANSPDSIAFAGILGLFLASRNSSGLIPLRTSQMEKSAIKS